MKEKLTVYLTALMLTLCITGLIILKLLSVIEIGNPVILDIMFSVCLFGVTISSLICATKLLKDNTDNKHIDRIKAMRKTKYNGFETSLIVKGNPYAFALGEQYGYNKALEDILIGVYHEDMETNDFMLDNGFHEDTDFLEDAEEFIIDMDNDNKDYI